VNLETERIFMFPYKFAYYVEQPDEISDGVLTVRETL
jgi:hypothetical protein